VRRRCHQPIAATASCRASAPPRRRRRAVRRRRLLRRRGGCSAAHGRAIAVAAAARAAGGCREREGAAQTQRGDAACASSPAACALIGGRRPRERCTTERARLPAAGGSRPPSRRQRVDCVDTEGSTACLPSLSARPQRAPWMRGPPPPIKRPRRAWFVGVDGLVARAGLRGAALALSADTGFIASPRIAAATRRHRRAASEKTQHASSRTRATPARPHRPQQRNVVNTETGESGAERRRVRPPCPRRSSPPFIASSLPGRWPRWWRRLERRAAEKVRCSVCRSRAALAGRSEPPIGHHRALR